VSLALDPSSFDVFTVPERVLAVGDPMAEAHETRLDLERTMERLGNLIDPAAGA
jgi:hypothetical protein